MLKEDCGMAGVRVSVGSVVVVAGLMGLIGLLWAPSGDAQAVGKMDRLEQRVADLEREIDLLKRTPVARPQPSPTPVPVPQAVATLQVEKLDIVNDKGATVCKLDADSITGGGRLRIYDHQGRMTAMFRCHDGGSLVLFGANGKMKKRVE
jgi:hypothetical protein